MSESNQEAREQGYREGRVETRLDEHQDHLKTINGTIKYGADETHKLRLDVQHMNDHLTARLDTVIATAEAAAATVVATAEALRGSEEARRTADQEATDKSTQSWTPWQRIFAVVVAVGVVVDIWARVTHH